MRAVTWKGGASGADSAGDRNAGNGRVHSRTCDIIPNYMDHSKAIELEHLLCDLVTKKTGTAQSRGSEYEGITMDADSLDKDDAAIGGLWLAVKLLQENPD